ncbi:AraC family transcriptional regulator [Cohnella hashimotonis]|uniref:Helix-turn-helix domain-containing protein n=1 Tax=Cohnella hashimotonis TaxID=2826895 RepID=A0ABT6TDX2_9BACL|nr:helix-turn-helix domain-containing protein [Cohnella hashimotonis]MDI4645018.1 helix-turn-helix domain-containing protein [Cohnella hashimotonis]
MFSKLRFFRKMSFQAQMLSGTLFLSLFPVALLGIASTVLLVSGVQQEADRSHRMILKQIEYQLNAFLADLKVSSLQISEDLIIRESFMRGISRDQFRSTMSMIDTIKKYRSVTRTPFGVTLVYPRHRQAYSTQYGLSSIDSRYYRQVAAIVNARYMGITIVTPDTYPGQSDLLIVKPVSVDNEIDGIVLLHVDITKFYEYLHQIDIGSTGVLVVDSRGRIVLSPNREEIGTRISSTSSLYAYWTNPAATSGVTEIGGETYSVTTFKSPANSWTYVAMTPEKELNRKASQIATLTWWIVAALAVLWGTVVFVGVYRMYMPIRRVFQKLPAPSGQKGDTITAIDSYMSDIREANEKLSGQLFVQLPLVRENVVLQLLHGSVPDEEMLERMRRYDRTFQGAVFYTGIVEIDALHEFMQMFRQEDRTSMMSELSAIVRGGCENAFNCIVVTPRPGQVAFIAASERSDDGEEAAIASLCDDIRREIRERYKFTVTAAIAPPTEGLREFGQGYQLAQEYLSFRYLLGPDATITRHDIERSDRIRSADRITAAWYKRILTSVSEGDYVLAEERFSLMFAELPLHLPDDRMIMGVLTYFLEEIDQLMQDIQGRSLQDLLGFNPYTDLYAQNTLGRMRDWFHNRFFPSIRLQLEQITVDKSRLIAERTLQYIHQHYDEDFSLQQLAGEFGVSSAQLSRYFKQTMNVNFVDYVIHYRISKAKEWLAYTDMPIKDISDRLRYTTTQNFTRVFKQIVGMPPGQYRNDCIQGSRTANAKDKGDNGSN